MRPTLRRAAPCALLWALASCATPSSPPPDIHAKRPPPEVCAAASPEPRIPDTAGFPQPVTDQEKAAVKAMLAWVDVALDWGRAGWTRAGKTKAWCDQQG